MLQNALRAASHNHTRAVIVRLLHNPARHLHHYIRVEAMFLFRCHACGQCSAAQGAPIHPSHP
jgi:hypothetical protein